MSKHHIEKVTCPSCHHEGDFEVWDSINTVLDPEMKEKVLNQSIFLYTCPNCGETFRLNYPTLYHQMEDLVMIYLVPESEVEKTYEMFYEENALADYRTEKYLNRIVTSANQLIEKIKIFDAGKDDRIIELVKLLAADSILKNNPAIDFDELRFAVDDDGTIASGILIDDGTISITDDEGIYKISTELTGIRFTVTDGSIHLHQRSDIIRWEFEGVPPTHAIDMTAPASSLDSDLQLTGLSLFRADTDDSWPPRDKKGKIRQRCHSRI